MNTNSSVFWWGGVVIIAAVVAIIVWLLGGVSGLGFFGQQATSTPGGVTIGAGTGAQASTVNSVIANLPNVSQFAALYSSTGVQASVAGKGPYTVFVPTDAAFGNLPSGTISNMTAAQKKRLMQYHVVAGKMLDFDAVWVGTHQALSKDTLNFSTNLQNKVVYVNSGYSIAQYRASNGIVYVISAVLVPPQTPSPTTGSTGTPTP